MAWFMPGAAMAADDYMPGEVLIKFKGATAPALMNTAMQGIRTRAMNSVRAMVLRRSSVSGMEQWKLPTGMSVASAIKQLKSNAQVEYVEPNYRRHLRLVPNDPLFLNQWGLQNTGQTINDSSGAVITGVPGADMGLATAWATQTGSTAVIVAVIDDSVDINHPDLAANIWTNPGETPGDGIDNDGNGFIDDVHGWDFKNNDNDPSADVGAGEGHGTAVSGCIGAVGNNNIGVSGVNWNVAIMPLKIQLNVASIAMAMDYAIAKGATVVNASFGNFTPSVTEQQAVQRLQNAGILLVAAAGNDNGNNDLVPDFPAGYANANIISVAASASADVLTVWSHYGATSVDIAAPGTSIFTTQSPNGSLGNTRPPTTGLFYDFIAGTSFSSPYVAGIAALIKAQFPAATFQELKGRIIASATQLTTMQGLISSGGRANAATALVMPVQPALVIGNVVWNDGGNGMIDPGETATFAIQLDNVWANATGVSATMTALSANLIVNTATVAYPNITSGTSQSANFSVTASPATGQQLYRFKLDISAAGAPVVTRYYQIGAGALSSGVTLNETLGKTAQDDYQIFFIDVPVGTANLVVQTTSARDIDLMLKPNGIPVFDFATYFQPPAPVGTQVAASLSGNETIGISNPLTGFYTVTVLNFSKLSNSAFTLTATLTATPPPATADLVVTNTDSPDPVVVGNNITYTITVTNNGSTSPATGVVLTDIFDASVSFVSATSNQGAACTHIGLKVSCNLGNITMPTPVTVSVVVTPNTVATINNTASVTGSELDPNVTNNIAVQASIITAPLAPVPTAGGGGCSITPNASFDPSLAMLLLLSAIALTRRRKCEYK